ncbi:hypothetical protein ROZALSC1DRAFT_24532, partial [Rozella allomycis CSF55]
VFIKHGCELKSFHESNPLKLYGKRIKENDFEQAKLIAKEFNLNTMDVLKSKFIYLREQDNVVVNEEMINELNEIEDEEFILDFCLNVECESIESFNLIYDFGIEKFPIMQSLVYKFGTFKLLNLSVKEWKRFKRIGMYEEAIKYLKQGDIYKSFVLIKRHFEEIENVLQVLENIPTNRNPKDYSILVSILIKEEMSEWVEKRCRFIEHYLQNASLALEFLNIVWKFNSNENINRLKVELELIVYLKEKHSIIKRLGDDLSDQGVINVMMERITCIELIPKEIENHIKPFCIKRGIDYEELIVDYCLKVEDLDFISSLINCLKSDDKKMELILNLLKDLNSENLINSTILLNEFTNSDSDSTLNNLIKMIMFSM